MFHGREKPAAVLLENAQLPKNIQITDKSGKLLIAKFSLLVKCLKYLTLYQAQEIKFLSQNANLNKAVQKFTHIIKCVTQALKEW